MDDKNLFNGAEGVRPISQGILDKSGAVYASGQYVEFPSTVSLPICRFRYHIHLCHDLVIHFHRSTTTLMYFVGAIAIAVGALVIGLFVGMAMQRYYNEAGLHAPWERYSNDTH